MLGVLCNKNSKITYLFKYSMRKQRAGTFLQKKKCFIFLKNWLTN
jgi:cytochrome c oxidase assembly protein Cox11